jgi:hypothetical protein
VIGGRVVIGENVYDAVFLNNEDRCIDRPGKSMSVLRLPSSAAAANRGREARGEVI